MRFTLLVISILFLTQCTFSDKKSQSDFSGFYERFHSDPNFQMEHIVFPLMGMKPDSSGRPAQYVWQKNEWITHKKIDESLGYSQRLEVVDEVIQETLSHKESAIKMIRRFAWTDEGWQLIFYASPGFY